MGVPIVNELKDQVLDSLDGRVKRYNSRAFRPR